MVNKQERYALVRLPSSQWQQQGEALVLQEHVRRVLVKYGIYRLLYYGSDRTRFGTYGLLVLKGPPGTGKSDAARWASDAVVRTMKKPGNALVVNVPALFDEHLGQSAKLVAQLFEEVELSATRGPTVVIWEDAEGMFMAREQSLASNDPTDVLRVVTTLLNGLDRLRYQTNVLQYATTNINGVMDPAILSRSDYTQTFDLPDSHQRAAILAPRVKGLAGAGVLGQLGAATEGWSGRQLDRINMLAFFAANDAATPFELTEDDYLRAVGFTPETTGKEEGPCTNSSNGYREEPTRRKTRSLWPWR